MDSYFIQSLSNLNVHKKIINPVDGKEQSWVLMIQAHDPVAKSVSIVTHSLLGKRTDLRIIPNLNGYYELQIDKSEPELGYRHFLTVQAADPSYVFGKNTRNKAALVLGGDELVAYLEGVRYEFDIEHSALGIKITEGATTTETLHEISYGMVSTEA